MTKTILLWIFWLFIITLVIYWIWSGGFGRAASAFRSAGNPFSTDGTSGGGFHLPWQPAVGIFAPAPASSGNGNAENAETSNPQDQYSAFENNYNQLNS